MKDVEVTFRGLPAIAAVRRAVERVSSKLRRLFRASSRFSWTIKAAGAWYSARCRLSAGARSYVAGARARRPLEGILEVSRRLAKQIRRRRKARRTALQRAGLRQKRAKTLA